MTIPAFGTTDLKLVLDKNMLIARPALADGGTASWDTSKVQVKGSGWSWANVELKDDGMNGDETAADGKYTFVLSNVVGAGKQFPHSGLGNSGDKFEFIFVFGPGDGVEYKDTAGKGATGGVTGFLKPSGGSFASAAVTVSGNNTVVTVP
jgi:hypothetical protein